MADPSPTARLLADGHVEFAHTCRDGRVVGTLPSPPWHVVKAEPLNVEPSVNCQVCGLHGWIGNPRWTVLPPEATVTASRPVHWVPSVPSVPARPGSDEAGKR